MSIKSTKPARKNEVTVADVTTTCVETGRYITETVTYHHIIKQFELNLEPGEFGYEMYAGKVYQADNVWRNNVCVSSSQYPAFTAYAQERIKQALGQQG